MTAVKIIPYERSFASHEKAEFWHTTKNEDIVPIDSFKSTHTKYWFNCNECNHHFESGLGTISNGRWCPYCAKPSNILCKDLSLIHI